MELNHPDKIQCTVITKVYMRDTLHIMIKFSFQSTFCLHCVLWLQNPNMKFPIRFWHAVLLRQKNPMKSQYEIPKHSTHCNTVMMSSTYISSAAIQNISLDWTLTCLEECILCFQGKSAPSQDGEMMSTSGCGCKRKRRDGWKSRTTKEPKLTRCFNHISVVI